VIVGLVVGKQVGITLFSWLAIRLGVASLPRGVTWRQLYGAAWLGGIGFTMSIFIANLAFGGTALLPIAKMGILLASLTAGTVGWFILAFTKTASLTHEAPATAPASSPDGVTSSLVADR
jgi:NhaA family Na+:H+ antiporter